MNNITLSKNYVPVLDEVYKNAETSSVLNSPEKDIKMGQKAGEFLIAKYSMDGLKDYSRNSGYKKGNVKLDWETHKANYDRGVKFEIDTMDNEESAELAFGKLAGEFARTQAAPEQDAFTYATLAGKDGVSITDETLTSGDDILNAIQREQSAMDEEEVTGISRYLFITSTLLRKAQNVEKYKSTGVLDEFAGIVKVPQKRFYTAINLLSGDDGDESIGGYEKASAEYVKTTDSSYVSGKTYYTKSGDTYTKVTGNTLTSGTDYYELAAESGKDINFMIVEKSAVLKWPKHTASDIIVPENNPDSDAYIQKHRKYGIVDIYENKVAGIRVSAKPLA